jgi:peptide chain release factor subunit 3
LVLIGHVDAGKSTLSGQILLLTGQIDERTIEKYEREAKDRGRESWWIAYIMDEDDEERAKGKTVECGRAHFETEKKRYTILDAPGHKDYVPNMISGASQADVALLIVSARTGEFEAGFKRGGQTREHSLLAWTLGINRLIVAVNKMDECDYAKERYDQIVHDITEHLHEIGYKDKYIETLPVSGQRGDNVLTRFKPGTCDWWKGKSLIETLDAVKKVKRKLDRPLRIPVLDRYKGDQGITVIGKIEAGVVKVGDTLCALPGNNTGVVSHVYIDDTPVDSAGAGENVLIVFDNRASRIGTKSVHGGSVLSSVEDPCPVVNKFVGKVYISEAPPPGMMTVGFSAMLHLHNCAVECEISALKHLIQRKTGRLSKRPPPVLRTKDSAVVEITVRGRAIPMETYSDVGQLGRFAMRDKGMTIVIGQVTELLETK